MNRLGALGPRNPRELEELRENAPLVLALDDEDVREGSPQRHLTSRPRSAACRISASLNAMASGFPRSIRCRGDLVAVGLGDGGERLVAVAAVRRGEDLDVEASRGLEHQPPHVDEHAVMQSGIDLVDKQHAAARAHQRQRDAEQAPDAVAHRADRDTLAGYHHRDPAARVARGSSAICANRRDALDRRLDRVECPEDRVLIGRQHDALEHGRDAVARQTLEVTNATVLALAVSRGPSV